VAGSSPPRRLGLTVLPEYGQKPALDLHIASRNQEWQYRCIGRLQPHHPAWFPVEPLESGIGILHQRDHDFGYQFGYRMFRPGGGYPDMDPDAVLYGGTDPGRDGCRVPLPWAGAEPPFGFSPAAASAKPWLPQPRHWAKLTVEAEQGDPGSMLSLYRHMLRIRRSEPDLACGDLRWLPSGAEVLAFARGEVEVNQAGEVSITRSRLESDVTQMRVSLRELTENLDRLRRQLRFVNFREDF